MARLAPMLLLLVGSVAAITIVVVARVRAWRAEAATEAPRSTAAVMVAYGVLLLIAVVVTLFVIAVAG